MKSSIILLIIMCCLFAGTSVNGQHKYGEILQKSMFFYEAQQAGSLSPNNRVGWRANAAMEDGNDASIDLTGGWFDAGDHVKFNFPMAYSVTTLCWGYLENKAAYVASNQEAIFLENVKHTTDYLLKCHTSPNEFYAQVGDGDEDHNYWVPAEVIHISSKRSSYKIDAANPGTDLAGETAAALAAASLIFNDSNPTYSATLLSHAKELYTFADNYRGKYSDVIPVGSFYKSWSGYQDELCWGAIWLYKATGDNSYLEKAKEEYSLLSNEEREDVKSYGWTLAWDDKKYGCYILMASLTGEQEYNDDAERFLDQWFAPNSNGKGPDFTPSGFPILDTWGSFRYAANTAFLMLEQSDNMTNASKKQQYRDRAKEITDYLLGDNPQETSYVIGYGNKFPLYPHHRTAHGPWNRDESIPEETRHTLYGALVGGHKTADDFDWVDSRHDYYWNEVACDYNSLFTGVVARLYSDFGGEPLSDFPQEETPNGEFLVEAKMNSTGTTHSEYAVWVHNRTAWPARVPSFKFRLFVDISEGVSAGYSASDYIISANTNNATISSLLPADAENEIYYVEVEFNSDEIIYPGGQSETRRESQVRIRLPYDAPDTAWDPSNDWSAVGVGADLTEVTNIPMYADGVLVFGNEPGPIEVIDVTGISISPETITINKGLTGALTATVSPSNASNKNVTWYTSDATIATVNTDGVVTAIAEGIATVSSITEDGGFTASSVITVTDIPLPQYTLTTDTLGQGSIVISPIGGIYDEGTIVSLSAVAASGYMFSGWSGDVISNDIDITVTMNTNKSITAEFTPQSTGCSSPIPITLPFEQNDVGEFCWVTSDEINFVNSWNMDKVEINGTDYTNKWANNMPDKINGEYIIHYVSSLPWSHLEVKLGTLKGATKTQKIDLNTDITIFPNPTSDAVTISNLPDATSILIFDVSGNKLFEENVNAKPTHRLDLSQYKAGSYIIKFQNNDVQLKDYIIIKR
ncbi:glycoside hydrolase family 9 protein [Saccharicrinis aurantiacus]|uniref:glycoside hydrolase family 9 protein n=1 Tax=Saccharicrinis aurantiacus TaxID=1849719 RepID=UPI000837B065|nr:glycoside hydrolase family 9 protein [Saccharicrinis aurantiacus]